MAIPALNSVISVPVFEESKPELNDVSAEGATLYATVEDYEKAVASWGKRRQIFAKVRLLDHGKSRGWAYAKQRIDAAERKRLRDRRAADPDKDDSGLHEKSYRTEEGSTEYFGHLREVVGALVVSVQGFEVEGVDVAEERNAERICDLLEHVGLIEFVYWAAMTAQVPRLAQVF